MRITWLGHGSFRIEIADRVILLDPWITGNPVFDGARRGEAIDGATDLLITHGHHDHTADLVAIARETGAPVAGMYELVNWFAAEDGVEGAGFNKGGTLRLGAVEVTMVAASHSSTVSTDRGPVPMGAEVGFMISGEGKTLYAMGDTDIMADMAWMGELHRPDYAIVPIGGHFTMDGPRAAWACRKYFSFKGVIPAHYQTFPLLAQSATPFVDAMAPTPVHVLDVMETLTL